jgi:hypothetical protein
VRSYYKLLFKTDGHQPKFFNWRQGRQGLFSMRMLLTLFALALLAVPAAGAEAQLLEGIGYGATASVPIAGSVEWSEGADRIGAPTLVAKAKFPERNLGVSVVIRRNTDKTVPASHIMEIDFGAIDWPTGGTVAGVPGVLMKNEKDVRGIPLTGASAKIADNAFLFGLHSAAPARASNEGLLTSRKWMDISVVHASDDRAIITLGKDDRADQLFNDVFAAWSKLDLVTAPKPTAKPPLASGASLPRGMIAAAPAPPEPATTTDSSGLANRVVKTFRVSPDGELSPNIAAPAAPTDAAPATPESTDAPAQSDTPSPADTPTAPRAKAVDDGYVAYNSGDYTAALALWTPLASKGDGDAQYALGDLYHLGHGVKQDDAEAARWYLKAANHNIAEAQYALGTVYAQGRGVPRDYVAAYMWYALATASGFDLAAADRDRTAALLTPAQLAKAKKLVRQWKPS